MGVNNDRLSFKGVDIYTDTPMSLSDQDTLVELIHAAKHAESDPYQSGFHVKTAAMTEDGDVVIGANHENSFSDAYAHGETAVISQIDSQFGRIGIRGMVFYNKSFDLDDLNIAPCGACRDVLEQRTGTNLLLGEGNERILAASRLENFVKHDFRETWTDPIDPVGAREAINALDRGFDSYMPQELRPLVYGASLVSENGSVYRGALYTNSGYDAIPPGLAAVQSWQGTVGDRDKKFEDLRSVTFARYGHLPDPLNRDRQAILELDEQLRQINDRAEPLRVLLLNVNPVTKEIVQVAKTDTEEWLPRPFSAASFGMHHVINRHFTKIGLAAQMTHGVVTI